jgi:hypothetical protein
MVKEFWNELLTKESWKKLTELAKEYDFILIGGWGAYLWTRIHKSKDIDIVVDYDVLRQLSEEFDVVKNARMSKYEIKFDKFDVDIYLPFFSKLAIPPEELDGYTTKIEGIKTMKPEALLVLKQAAEIERRGSAKGRKDEIDIATLLLHTKVNLNEYMRILKKYKHENFVRELEYVVRNLSDRDLQYLGIGFNEFKKWKKKTLEEIKKHY